MSHSLTRPQSSDPAVPDLAAEDLADWHARALAFEAAVGSAVIGQSRAIRLLTLAVFCRGHVLLEGDVGVGKTTLLRAVARAIGGPYERIEGTIDLMPTDVVYAAYIGADGRPRVDPGPILRHGADLAVFFFNEINRARPQVHSLLLRAMAERSLTAFQAEHAFPHLQVFADRNKVEREETFELPAAARDRFFMEIAIDAPADPELRRRLAFDTRYHDADALVAAVSEAVLDFRQLGGVAAAIQSAVHAGPEIEAYVFALWETLKAPHLHGIDLAGIAVERLVQGGASPRGVSALVRAARANAWIEGRDFVAPDDVAAVFAPVMSHRVFLTPAYEARREAIVPAFIDAVFAKIPTPRRGG
ncbi:AAA family ATPase [Methylobrevis pamukkalensis]|uniref:ATPase family associated with various cellular activities (AAA) n=1 Tax=Methylobrevis pamukkalensis TaxID=1439726 RepID=A0A1E3H6N2_9HYPH|nr:MoxR family ATPase [Methylobrevis pamukkalensis]ODN71805.1 ATPase family associated with various cellular activities (AAA) [Methylobrevis pamukkalensis]